MLSCRYTLRKHIQSTTPTAYHRLFKLPGSEHNSTHSRTDEFSERTLRRTLYYKVRQERNMVRSTEVSVERNPKIYSQRCIGSRCHSRPPSNHS